MSGDIRRVLEVCKRALEITTEENRVAAAVGALGSPTKSPPKGKCGGQRPPAVAVRSPLCACTGKVPRRTPPLTASAHDRPAAPGVFVSISLMNRALTELFSAAHRRLMDGLPRHAAVLLASLCLRSKFSGRAEFTLEELYT